MRNLIILSSLILITSCVENEINMTGNDAAIRAKFIPADSLSKLEMQLTDIGESRNSFQDQLDKYDSLDAAGDPTDYTEIITKLNGQLDSLKTVQNEVDERVNEFEDGDILLDFLGAEETSEIEDYSFSKSIYRLPLNPASNQTTFLAGYGGQEYSSTFSYHVDTVFKEQSVKLLATQIKVNTFDFDSVRVYCDSTNCTSDEIFVIFYF